MFITLQRVASRGDGEAFAAFVAPHLVRMAIVARRLGPAGEHEDVVQEALIRAWRSFGSFSEEKGTSASWLCTIVANVARSHTRRARRAPMRVGPERVVDVEGVMDLDQAIERLPQRQRAAVACFYAAGLSVAETAAVMGCAEGTVKSTLADARLRLRELLEPKGGTIQHGRY